ERARLTEEEALSEVMLCITANSAPRLPVRVNRDRCSRSCLAVHVRFGPKATHIRRCREATRWAKALNRCAILSSDRRPSSRDFKNSVADGDGQSRSRIGAPYAKSDMAPTSVRMTKQ